MQVDLSMMVFTYLNMEENCKRIRLLTGETRPYFAECIDTVSRKRSKRTGKHQAAARTAKATVCGYRETETLIREGFPAAAGKAVKDMLGIFDKEIAAVMGMSQSTYQRELKEHKRLSLVESDRLYRIARILAIAADCLGDEELAREWLTAPQFGLGESIPLKAIETEEGAREVEKVLGRITHGVIS